jgi:hypothetical protein
MSYMTEFIVSLILLSDTVLQCCYITEDDNRVKIDPDKLRNGLDHYASSSDKAELFEFLARYVRKVYPDTDTKKDLKNNEGFLFIDRITPSDIAFVISILKNGCNFLDQTIKMKQLGAAVHGERETRLQPLFTGGKRKKKEQGISLWSVEELKYLGELKKNGKRCTQIMRKSK